jgi:hypothetical protein
VVLKAKLNFRLRSATRIADYHLVMLNLRNVGSYILKNLVVQMHSPDPKFSVDCKGCFVYSLMPNEDETVTFRVLARSIKKAYFSVNGYASGDQYFSIKSPYMAVQTKRNLADKMLQ